MRFKLECGKRFFWNVILSPHPHIVGELRPMAVLRKRIPFVLAVFFLLIVTTFAAKAQDLTGQWTGTSNNSLSDNKQKIVLNIATDDSVFAGVLHAYFPETRLFRNFIIRGQFHHKDSTVSIREDNRDDSVNDSSPDDQPENDNSPYILYYKRVGHREVLEGHGAFAIHLEKKATPFIPLPPVTRKKDSAKSKELIAMDARQTPLIMAIPVPFRLDSVKIELFDNGEIDGDSVSLFLNDQLILSHLYLKAESKVVWLPLDKTLPVNKLVLFAENLGSIPPNTAVMQVTVKGKRYTIFLSTDYKHNAMVEFILQE